MVQAIIKSVGLVTKGPQAGQGLKLVVATATIPVGTVIDIVTGLKTIMPGGWHVTNTKAVNGVWATEANGTVSVHGTNTDTVNLWALGI
jgi:hypothetical protein